ncbi:unnamed protein product [Cyclocybe aegerita]|uniref:DUF6699 domain-containing protein n=1 Tax=Cyclocybe aegerita TaxID=1973307 RepID=A0A8S0W5Y1_CYCAE|nr:unnamed protein product [Cyclocybe aegerita]
MSGPFVYTPNHEPAPLPYRNSPYLHPFYSSPNSPFIPPMSLNASPYQAVSPLPGSPILANSPLGSPYAANQVQFPGGSPGTSPYVPAWVRPRRQSWNSGPFLRAPVRQRTLSDYTNYYTTPPFAPVAAAAGYWPHPGPHYPPYSAPVPTQLFLHPFLDAQNPRSDVVFNLAAPDFAPMRYIGANQTVPMTLEELGQTATHPAISELTISADVFIPGWPFDLNFTLFNPYTNVHPPIKVGDVLSAIYYQLQKQISQQDWASLPPELEHEVAKAYTKRCKSFAPGELTLLNQGVKQVDFLKGRVWFKGLLKAPDGSLHMKLVAG